MHSASQLCVEGASKGLDLTKLMNGRFDCGDIADTDDISITTNDHQAVVDEVGRGEHYVRAKFEHAMKDIDVSP